MGFSRRSDPGPQFSFGFMEECSGAFGGTQIANLMTFSPFELFSSQPINELRIGRTAGGAGLGLGSIYTAIPNSDGDIVKVAAGVGNFDESSAGSKDVPVYTPVQPDQDLAGFLAYFLSLQPKGFWDMQELAGNTLADGVGGFDLTVSGVEGVDFDLGVVGPFGTDVAIDSLGTCVAQAPTITTETDNFAFVALINSRALPNAINSLYEAAIPAGGSYLMYVNAIAQLQAVAQFIGFVGPGGPAMTPINTDYYLIMIKREAGLWYWGVNGVVGQVGGTGVAAAAASTMSFFRQSNGTNEWNGKMAYAGVFDSTVNLISNAEYTALAAFFAPPITQIPVTIQAGAYYFAHSQSITAGGLIGPNPVRLPRYMTKTLNPGSFIHPDTIPITSLTDLASASGPAFCINPN